MSDFGKTNAASVNAGDVVKLTSNAVGGASHLVPLDEFNAERRERHTAINDPSPRPNGIACPECGAELLDSRPMITLTSNPPQKDVHCEKCAYRGYRVA